MVVETLTSKRVCFAWPLRCANTGAVIFFCYLKHICNAEKPWKYWSFFNLVTDNRCLYIFEFELKKYIRKSIKRKYPVWSVICYLTPWNPGVFRAFGALHIYHTIQRLGRFHGWIANADGGFYALEIQINIKHGHTTGCFRFLFCGGCPNDGPANAK